VEELTEKERLQNLDPDWSSWYIPPRPGHPPGGYPGGLRTFRGILVRTFAAGAILVLALFVRSSTWPPAARAREDLKYALTTEWDYRPVLAGAVGYGLKLARNWPVVKDLMAPGSTPANGPVRDNSSYADWVSPVKGRVIVPFGWVISPLDGMERFSPGVDVAAPAGTPVKAAMAGKVARIGTDARYGRYVLLDHGDGTYTLYGYLTGVEVFPGELVATGQTLGKVAPAKGGPACLHFELREKDKLVDPASRIDLSPARH